MAVAEAPGAALVEVLLTRVGLRAPHGWSSRHDAEQALFWPHLVTHWLPHSVQVK